VDFSSFGAPDAARHAIAAAIAIDDGAALIAALRVAALMAGRQESEWPLAKLDSVWAMTELARQGKPDCFLACLREVETLDVGIRMGVETRALVDLATFLRVRAGERTVHAELAQALDSFLSHCKTMDQVGSQLAMLHRFAGEFDKEVAARGDDAVAAIRSEAERGALAANLPAAISEAKARAIKRL
jgi:hypothetical protein